MTTDIRIALIQEEVFQERLRQVKGESYSPEHERPLDDGDLAMAAAALAVQSTGQGSGADILWPIKSLMPTYPTRRARLIVAAALILAEIDRIDLERAAV